MTTQKKSSPEAEGDSNRELTREELINALTIEIAHLSETQKQTGVEIVFPKKTTIDRKDVGGKTINEVLEELRALAKEYEPPINQELREEGDTEKTSSEIPEWLKGYESLLWHGSTDNPLWRVVQATQYEDKVIVSYARRQQELRPGKTSTEQSRTLPSVKNSFSLAEWKVAEQIFSEYTDLEHQLTSPKADVRKETRKQIQEVLKEENAFRKGKSKEVPQILLEKVNQAIEQTFRRTRSRQEKANIDTEDLTQRIAEMLSQLFILNRERGDGKDKVPTLKPDIKEIPSFGQNLKELSRCLHTQQKKNKGLTLMIGEAGAGKNQAAEYLSAKTNRPYFWFPCGRGMEAVDLVQHYEFDTREGTKRFLTALAEGLQTPGAVVHINEASALKTEVQAILHGFGDSNRALNYDGINIPVAKDVMIIIDMNPATYGSSGNLGEALLSRTRGQSMVMEYPALKKGELLQREKHWTQTELESHEQDDNTLQNYASDEVLILFPSINLFQDLTDEEFSVLWDFIINEQEEKLPEIEGNESLRELVGVNIAPEVSEKVRNNLTGLRDILRISDEWRKAYEKREGSFSLIGISMRDTIAVADEYANCGDVKLAFMRTFQDFAKNPIDGVDQVVIELEALITKTLGGE